MTTSGSSEAHTRNASATSPTGKADSSVGTILLGGMKIGTKLNLGFGVLVALTLLVIGITYLSSDRATRSMHRATDVRAPTALASARAQANLLRMLGDVRGYLALGDAQYRSGYEQAKQEFETDLGRLETHLQPGVMAVDDRLADIKRSLGRWTPLPAQLFDLHDDQLEREPALKLLIKQGNPLIARILVNTKGLLANQKRRKPSQESMNMLSEMARFQSSFIAMISGLRGYVTTGRTNFKFEYTSNLAINEGAAEKLEDYEPLLKKSDQKRLKKMLAARDKFLPLPESMFEIVEGARSREDLYLFRTEAIPAAEIMLNRLNDVTVGETRLLEEELNDAGKQLASVQTQILLAGVAALLLGIGLAIVLRRNIAGPIQRLTLVAEQVGAGDLQTRAREESTDEIGILARTFNSMTGRLSETLEDLEERRREQQAAAETLRRQNEYLAALHETTLGLISRLEVSDLLEALIERAGQMLGTPHAYIYLADEGGAELQRKIGVGIFRESIGYALKRGQGLAGRVWDSGEPLVVNDYADWEGRPADTRYAVDVGAIMGVPLKSGERVVGVLGMAYDVEAGKTFGEDEMQLLGRFGELASLSLDNARLYTTAREARAQAEGTLRELRDAQQNLVQAEKMASLGQLTAGIAHEIKNPLNFVNNFADSCSEILEELEGALKAPIGSLDVDARKDAEDLFADLSAFLQKIREHGQRADGIVKGMLSHAREEVDVTQSTDLNALLEESLNLAYHGARAENSSFNVTLERDLDPNLGELEIYPQKMIRVFLNLISNGFYAAHQRQAQSQDSDYQPTVRVSTRAAGDNVEIIVRDNGTGIPADALDKLFEPFFTTKPTGEGTGLGLSLSYETVVQQHQGALDVNTEPGEFTEFVITLPRNADGAGARGGRRR
jgi:signal transduction histidine kinase